MQRLCLNCVRSSLAVRAFSGASVIAPQYVFNGRSKQSQRARAAAAPDFQEYEYLRSEVASRLVGRLADVSRQFPVALDLGSNAGSVLRQLLAQRTDDGQLPGGIGTLHTLEACAGMQGWVEADGLPAQAQAAGLAVQARAGSLDGAALPYADASMDLVLSSMALHWVNDVPGLLAEVRRVLKPDGAFIAAFLGGETLMELRQAASAAEQERDGGVSPHVSPTMMLADAGNLLTAAGFALPLVDADTFSIEYPSVPALYRHLRAMGESNAALGARPGARRDTLLATAAVYGAVYGEEGSGVGGPVPATFQVMYMIGWAPAEGQPAAKARGSVPKGFSQRLVGSSAGPAPPAAGGGQ